MKRYDMVILNGTAVLPWRGPVRMDLGIKEGTIAAMADSLPASDGEEVLDARGLYVLPGAVDSHFHIGIYRPHSQDALSESGSAVSGGVTSILSYFRTGQHYLNKVGPYAEIFPEVLALSKGNFWCDYGYHIAPMTAQHLDEVDWLIDQGVSSFKFYMFYKGLSLTAESTRGREYAMAEDYDLGHLYELMTRVSEASRDRNTRISLSLHCENPELIRVFIARVKKEGLAGLEAYSKARPPLTERLSIGEAGVLANATECPINLLHLSSKEAVESALELRLKLPERDFKLEATLHHLVLNYEDTNGFMGKVNPPIRAREDQKALWKMLLGGHIDTVVSDHACCMEEWKQKDLWSSLPGFGGTSLLYPVLLSEGARKKGLPLARVVELASANPARAFGLYPKKGTIAVGSDADLAICDLERIQTVAAETLHSAQDFTPFTGLSFTGWPVITLLRGQVVFRDGAIQGTPSGQFLRRPVDLHASPPKNAEMRSHELAGESR